VDRPAGVVSPGIWPDVANARLSLSEYIKGDLTAADILERVKIIPADECTD